MSDKVEQALYFPETMLQAIKDEGARLDRSLSWCVQRAWKISKTAVTALPSVPEGAEELPSSPALDAAVDLMNQLYSSDGIKRKQTLYFPEPMLVEIKAEATRMDRSLSWVTQIAWCLAEDEIKGLTAESSGDD